MPPWLKASHPFSFTLEGWLVVELLPLLGDIVEPEDEDVRPEGDGESDEEQGDKVLHGCKHENDFITLKVTRCGRSSATFRQCSVSFLHVRRNKTHAYMHLPFCPL